MRAPKAISVSSLICEDVRTEASQRLSMMGIFGPNLDIEGPLPAVGAQLCAVVIVMEPQEALSHVTVSVTGPAGQVFVPPVTQEVAPPPEGSGAFAHQFQVRVAPIPFTAEGDIIFRFTFNNTDEIGVELRLAVRLRPTADRQSPG